MSSVKHENGDSNMTPWQYKATAITTEKNGHHPKIQGLEETRKGSQEARKRNKKLKSSTDVTVRANPCGEKRDGERNIGNNSNKTELLIDTVSSTKSSPDK